MSEELYIIKVKKERIDVSYEIYKAYFQEQEHARYVKTQSRRYELSLERFEDSGVHPYHTGHTHGLEDEYIEREVHRRLEKAIAILRDEEQSLLREIFYEGKTEREIAQSLGISQVGVHKRKEKILARLKIFLES